VEMASFPWPEGDDRPRRAIETARAWIRGEASIDEVRAAANAAYAAYAANAANAAANTAANAAAYAAANAANFAGILYTDAPASGEADAVEPMDLIELERNMLLTMPGGWKMSQLQPEQPATTYAEFKHEILNEIARCLNMPYNIAAGNSSGYNYSSGRLDHQTYFKAIRVDQDFIARTVLDRILHIWLTEYLLASNKPVSRILPPHQWFWDGMEHVDPYKEANAQKLRLASNTTTLAYEYARQGRDWEEELRQIAREKNLMRELGLTSDDLNKNNPSATENKANG